jgi:hypothetical protein
LRNLSITTLLILSLSGCQAEPVPPAPGQTEWRRVSSWSGRGNQQLETFPIEGWIWRVRWEAGNEDAGGGGMLRVAAMSADSGREIAEITDVRGADHDTKYLSDLPRRYYLEVVSAKIEWSLVVEEPVK